LANQEHLDILKQGAEAWNHWRQEHLEIQTDLTDADLNGTDLREFDFNKAYLSRTRLNHANLSESNLYDADLNKAYLSRACLRGANLRDANLSGANLYEADLRKAHLSGATLSGAILSEADLSRADLRGATLSGTDLSGADLSEADLYEADLYKADLSEADLSRADLRGADLSEADLSRAILSEANLRRAVLVETNLTGATLTRCSIYGISVWNVQLEGAKQDSLDITPPNEPTVTVDNLKFAQFIYLLLNNKEIREVIDTITSKVVLILGRFTPERKTVLDELKEAFRRHNYSPILFDFEKPSSRDFTETVRTLAHLARFIIADLTEPSSIPQELQAIVPDLEVAVQPLILEAKKEYAMFVDFKKYHWVLPVYLYKDLPNLLVSFEGNIIDPAEKKVRELAIEKAKRLERP
jgi:uncharacterized protein YjbI with pentapeptide repeats